MAAALTKAMQTKEANFFRHGVRHLYLGSSGDSARTLLRLCPSIVSFAYISPQGDPSLLAMAQEMRGVRRWSGCLEDLFDKHTAVDLSLPVFSTVTHMDVFDDVDGSRLSTQICLGLTALPALTHLCLNRSVEVESLQRLLEQCAHLQVLVVMWSHRIQAGEMVAGHCRAGVTDARYVVAVCDDYWSDWEVGARGGMDFWAAADAFIAQKRRGEIEGALSFDISGRMLILLSQSHAIFLRNGKSMFRRKEHGSGAFVCLIGRK